MFILISDYSNNLYIQEQNIHNDQDNGFFMKNMFTFFQMPHRSKLCCFFRLMNKWNQSLIELKKLLKLLFLQIGKKQKA